MRSRVHRIREVPEDHDRGLGADLAVLLDRRRALALFGGAGLALAAGCAATTDTSTSASSSTSTSSSVTASTAGASTSTAAAKTATSTTAAGATTSSGSANATTAIPEETAGPFPGDGSNGVNVLTQSGVVRSDIRSSFGSSATVAEGVPLTVKLRVLSVAKGGAALANAAVYLWHCDRDGGYSLYSQGVGDENYLRGVQQADADGNVTFTSIFPGAYSGRWPHIHFEVYPDLTTATKAGRKLRTSQLALPKDVCDSVYATSGYDQSVRNLADSSLSTDMVFRDGWTLQLPTMSGTAGNGLTASLNVPV